MSFESTPLREQLVQLLVLHGPQRTDWLGSKVGKTPSQVSASLLGLRDNGCYVASTNDGSQYNLWSPTQKLVDFVNQRYLAQQAEQREREARAVQRVAPTPPQPCTHDLAKWAVICASQPGTPSAFRTEEDARKAADYFAATYPDRRWWVVEIKAMSAKKVITTEATVMENLQ